MQRIHQFFTEIKTPFSWRRIWVIILTLCVLVGVFVAGVAAYAATYRERVLPGVYIGNISVGGMTRTSLINFLQQMNDKFVSDGFVVTFDDGQREHVLTLYPVLVVDGDSIELMHMDIATAADDLIAFGKDGDIVSRGLLALKTRIQPIERRVGAIAINEREIKSTVADFVKPLSTPPRDAGVHVTSIDPLSYETVTSSPGIVYAYEQIPQQLFSAWSELRSPDIRVRAQVKQPTIREDDITALEPRLPSLFDDGGLTLMYTDPQTRAQHNWTVPVKTIGSWLTVTRNDSQDIVLGFDMDAARSYLDTTIAPAVAREPQDAKFSADSDGRVIEFQASRPGLELDVDATYAAMNDALEQRMHHDEGTTSVITLIVHIVEPNLTTGEVNDLGIQEILGVGVSDFSGSPQNRRRNIANGVKKLNGVVIQPGEEFSAIEYTKPYTEEGGYLSELVIKGDEIKPEIGGGLCQIGTTLFRMAMNSGMEITQRQNHSLVVPYYNDLENGLPGTDATIYDPVPDFRFRNDTKHAVLIQTEMDAENGRLYFTLWGTNDGRKGSYSQPEVKRWIPNGETKIVETTKLPPGQRKCQHAYKGAETAFTYSRKMGDGSVQNKVFESYYRPLPEICLVGVEAQPSCEEGAVCVNEEQQQEAIHSQFNPDGSEIIPE